MNVLLAVISGLNLYWFLRSCFLSLQPKVGRCIHTHILTGRSDIGKSQDQQLWRPHKRSCTALYCPSYCKENGSLEQPFHAKGY